jgi:hypothetical protein
MARQSKREQIVRAAGVGNSVEVEELLQDGVSPDARTLRPEGKFFGGDLKIHQGETKFVLRRCL